MMPKKGDRRWWYDIATMREITEVFDGEKWVLFRSVILR